MFERVLGKKQSIQRSLVISFIISIVLVIILTIIEFFIFVNPSMNVNVNTDVFVYVIKRGLVLAIFNVILISAILISINTKKMLQPIKKINEATKKVSLGNYDIELETNRKDEIGELIENFNNMTKGLKSTESLKKEFINNVSHEIKTPISSIEGFAKLLKDKNLSNEEREEYADIIIEESERLANLTKKMLKLSKLHNQDRIINKQKIFIEEQIRKALSLLEPKWSKKNIKINMNVGENVFLGDEELVFQIWVNLLDNAIKFSKENGEIDINTFEKNEYINVVIKDYGVGMQADELEKVFERFYQVDKSHSEEGSGLGLAIVERIIELSEGKIDIESKENFGTVVTVKLPIQLKDREMVSMKKITIDK